MVRIVLATLSAAAFASVAVQAQPINFGAEDTSELVERGAFGRLGRIFRPLIQAATSGGLKNAAKTAVQGHAKANNHFRREFMEAEDDLLSREDLEDLSELVERGAFGRLGRIFRPLISAAAKGGFKNSAKTVVQGHSKANNNFRREFDFDEMVERYFGDEDDEMFERSFGEENLDEMD
ncbi:hypothetical protein D9611_007255 [Ephemerocybe angulata]|uniref:Uncharacterized protein n=1 Tax=Ephemerocybe angulata TaxID=980116 RepID=A0A8H5B2W8_9AGAR|nr:hypothetical protein D9611_007255 [Tulosesus angulatus]